MHNLILGKRNAGAMQRILTTSKLLAEYFEIDPALASALKVQENDPIVRAMKEREGVADLLDAIASEIGLIKPDSNETSVEVPASVLPLTTTVVDEAFIDAGKGLVEAGEGLVEAGEGDTGEGLPEPVIEEAVSEEKKTSRKKASS